MPMEIQSEKSYSFALESKKVAAGNLHQSGDVQSGSSCDRSGLVRSGPGRSGPGKAVKRCRRVDRPTHGPRGQGGGRSRKLLRTVERKDRMKLLVMKYLDCSATRVKEAR